MPVKMLQQMFDLLLRYSLPANALSGSRSAIWLSWMIEERGYFCASGRPVRAASSTCKMAAMLTLAISASSQKEA